MNRLDDLKKKKKKGREEDYDIEIGMQDDDPRESTVQGGAKGDGVGGTSKGSMEEFFKIVEIVKKSIVVIRESAKEIIDINQRVLLATTDKEEEKSSEQLQEIIKSGNKNARSAQVLLKDLNKEVQENESSNSLPQSELRIRKNLIQTLTKKYIDVLKEYQDAQNKAKEEKKMRAKKRILQVKPDATTEEIDAMLVSGGADALLKQQILQGDASEVIKNAVENANNKYKDVLKLEQSINELGQMFQDFALIIEKQGELLDQIEHQVKSAGDYVDQGNVETQQAITYLISARKKQCCICITILIIIGIIIGIIAGTIKKPGS